MDFGSIKSKVSNEVKAAEDDTKKVVGSAETAAKNTVQTAKDTAVAEKNNITSKFKKSKK